MLAQLDAGRTPNCIVGDSDCAPPLHAYDVPVYWHSGDIAPYETTQYSMDLGRGETRRRQRVREGSWSGAHARVQEQ